MRLLRLEDDGAIGLVEYVGSDIPPYAILSHTWGPDSEEVTFKDMTNGSGKTRSGYRKLVFCGQQAAVDGLRYFWVDTCCIDKSSSAELSEAINSMFQWYQRAYKCYAYLSDVSSTDVAGNKRSFLKSRWFTRGWTLQELIAPASVEFYSSEGEKFGDKHALVQEIHDSTGIAVRALQGAPLSTFTIDERLAWAQRRETKREEDASYSLLGIFDIQMPLLYGEGQAKAFKRLQKEIKESLSGETDIMARIPENVPVEGWAAGGTETYRVPFSLKGVPVMKFADRPQDMDALERAVLPQGQKTQRRTLVVHGLGGAGKTQLVADFARRHQHSFSLVLWLDGSGESSIKQSLAEFASRVPAGQIPEASRTCIAGVGGGVDAAVKDVLTWMSKPGNDKWLMVMDNVDRDYRRRDDDAEAYDVERYIPDADHGSVLITTRLPHLSQLGKQWEVKKVAKTQARAIFSLWYGKDFAEEGDELLGLLDGLPLALAQAAAYMNETGTGFSTYTRLYKERWAEIMEPREGEDRPLRGYANGSVATTWNISFAAIRTRSQETANLILLWAHLDNKRMWHGLIANASQKSNTAAERTSAWLGDMARSEVSFIRAIGMLRSYSLVEGTEDQEGYAMHPVVHQWALHVQDKSQKSALAWLAVVLVGLMVPTREEKRYWTLQAKLMPHAVRSGQEIEMILEGGSNGRRLDGQESGDETLLSAFHNFGHLYADRGQPIEAEQMYNRALRGRESVLGVEHPLTLDTVHNLGSVYVDLDKLDKAEHTYLRALRGKEKALGEEHMSTLLTVNRLGVLYRNLGKLDDSEQLYERALQGTEKARGAEHMSTLDIVHNLGDLYRSKGKLALAERMYLRALEGTEKELGAEHTSTLSTVHSLGLLYFRQGKLDDAEKMYKRALQGTEKVQGAGHTSTLDIVHNLGDLYRNQGKLDLAEQMYLQALKGTEQALGPEHTSTLDTIHSLGNLYVNLSKLDEAEQMYVRALQGTEKTLGAGHESTLSTINNLGYLYAEQGKTDEAEKMYLQALQGKEKALGAEHMSTTSTCDSLGLFYEGIGKLEEAERYFLRALDGYEKAMQQEVFVESRPALDTMRSLAFIYDRWGRVEDARRLYERALEGYLQVDGEEYPVCRALRDRLAQLAEKEDEPAGITSSEPGIVQDQVQTSAGAGSKQQPQASKRRRILKKFSRNRKSGR